MGIVISTTSSAVVGEPVYIDVSISMNEIHIVDLTILGPGSYHVSLESMEPRPRHVNCYVGYGTPVNCSSGADIDANALDKDFSILIGIDEANAVHVDEMPSSLKLRYRVVFKAPGKYTVCIYARSWSGNRESKTVAIEVRGKLRVVIDDVRYPDKLRVGEVGIVYVRYHVEDYSSESLVEFKICLGGVDAEVYLHPSTVYGHAVRGDTGRWIRGGCVHGEVVYSPSYRSDTLRFAVKPLSPGRLVIDIDLEAKAITG